MTEPGRARWLLAIAVGVAAVALLATIHGWIFRQARVIWHQATAWGINPWIFMGMLVATTFHYYKSWFLIARGIVRRDRAELVGGIALNRFVWAIPYIYVLAFGRGYPRWVPIGVGVWMLLGIAAFIHNLRQPDYLARMTHSRGGRLTLRLMGKPNDFADGG